MGNVKIKICQMAQNMLSFDIVRSVYHFVIYMDNIEMDLEEVGRGCGDWMELAKDRDSWRALVSTVMNFGVP